MMMMIHVIIIKTNKRHKGLITIHILKSALRSQIQDIWTMKHNRSCILKSIFSLDILFIIEQFLSQDDFIVILNIAHDSSEKGLYQMGSKLHMTCGTLELSWDQNFNNLKESTIHQNACIKVKLYIITFEFFSEFKNGFLLKLDPPMWPHPTPENMTLTNLILHYQRLLSLS